MLAAALASIAIVTQDQTALRAAPREAAPQQVALYAGDSLEVRAAKGDYLQVWDHRRERGGFVRANSLRLASLAPEAAPELLAIARFLEETPGAEALGIAYATAYLRAVAAEDLSSEAFALLGNMAERLARRASAKTAGKGGEALAAQLDIVAAYGVNLKSFERDGKMQVCYDGEAFGRVLALSGNETLKAQAALALTRHDCLPSELPPLEKLAYDEWRAEVLERVKLIDLPEVLKNRLRIRKAGVWAGLAFERARHLGSEDASVVQAAQRAWVELAAINKSELTEADANAYNEAAIRVGASRWAGEAQPASPTKRVKLGIELSRRETGETCVHLVDARHEMKNALLTRCTYGLVWPASATANAPGTALALAVQPLDGWRELWVFRAAKEGWTVEILPPSAKGPGLGYVEFAGWVPGKEKLLAARETRTDGRYLRRFEVLRLETLETEKQADRPGNLSTFYRWQSPAWKATSVALR